jgi:hypothetical protein
MEGGDGPINVKDAIGQDSVMEVILDMEVPVATTSAADKEPNNNHNSGSMKRRISFCTSNNLYYSQDGKVQTAPARKAKSVASASNDRNAEDAGRDEEDDVEDDEMGEAKKKYDQCPPFKGLLDRDLEIGTMV